MKVKITGLKKLEAKYLKMLPDARSKWAKEMKATIVDILVEKITSGNSPVSGQNRYKKYSPEYAKHKGRSAPVDLVDSGDMLNNMRARQTAQKTVVVEFPNKDQNAKASYHNSGSGNMPKRKLLPTGKERFKADIMARIVQALRKAVRESLK